MHNAFGGFADTATEVHRRPQYLGNRTADRLDRSGAVDGLCGRVPADHCSGGIGGDDGVADGGHQRDLMTDRLLRGLGGRQVPEDDLVGKGTSPLREDRHDLHVDDRAIESNHSNLHRVGEVTVRRE